MAYPSLSHPPPPALAPAPVEHVLICRKIVTGVEVLKNLELPVALSSRIRFEAGERDLLIALVNPDNNEVHHLELRKRQEGSHGRPFAKQNSWRQLMLSRQINHGSTMIFRTTNVQNRFLLEVEDAGDSDDDEAGDGVPDDTSDDNPHDSQEQAPNTRGNLLLDPQVRRPFLSGADSSDNIYEGRTFQFEQSDRVLFTFANLLSPHLCGSKFICLDYDKKGLIYDGNIGEKIGELGYCGRPERKVNSQIEGFADAEREIVPYVFFKKIWTALNGDQYEDMYWRYVGIQAKGWGIPIRPSKAVVIETGAALLQGSKVPSTGDHGFLVTAWPITHDTLEEEKVLEKYGVVWDQTSHEIKLNNVRKNCFAWSLTNCMVATGSLDTNKPASHGITIRGAHLGGVYGESRHK